MISRALYNVHDLALIERVRAEARRAGVSSAAVMRAALAEYLEWREFVAAQAEARR